MRDAAPFRSRPDGPQSRREVPVGGGLICATHPALAPIPPTIGSEMIYARAGWCHDGDIHRSSTSDFFEFTSSLCEVCAFTRISLCYLHCHRHHYAPVGERDSSCTVSGQVTRRVGPLGLRRTFPRATTGPRGSPGRHMLANKSVPTANAGCLPPPTPGRPTEVDLPCLVHALFAAASRHRRCGAKKTNQIIAQHPSKN